MRHLMLPYIFTDSDILYISRSDLKYLKRLIAFRLSPDLLGPDNFRILENSERQRVCVEFNFVDLRQRFTITAVDDCPAGIQIVARVPRGGQLEVVMNLETTLRDLRG